MADEAVETEETEEVEEYTADTDDSNVAVEEQPLITQSVETGHLYIRIPTETARITSLVSELQSYKHVKGVNSLINRSNKYLDHVRLCEAFRTQMQASIRYLSGKKASKSTVTTESKARKVATAFYNSLNEVSLKKQCALFKINYAYYEEKEDVVHALINAHVEMMGGE